MWYELLRPAILKVLLAAIKVMQQFFAALAGEKSFWVLGDAQHAQCLADRLSLYVVDRFCAAATLYIFHIVELLFIEIFGYLKTLGEGDVELQL